MIIIHMPPPKSPEAPINIKDIVISTTFTATVAGHSGLFLRDYSGIVLLNNPVHRWDFTARIYNFKEVDIEITVK